MTIRSLYFYNQSTPTGTMRAYRNVILSGELKNDWFEATQLRVRFFPPSSGNYYISGASIGVRSGSTVAYVSGEYTRLQFGGNDYVRVETNVPEVSDWIDIPTWFSYQKNYMVHFDLSGESSTPYVSKTNGVYRKDGTLTDCMVESPSGYSSVNYTYGLERIQLQNDDGIDEVITTFDSGGAGSLPGGENPDYTSLTTWEADTDTFLLEKEALEIYDSQTHSITSTVQIAGATLLSRTIYREMRGSPSCAVPFDGKAGTGPTFSYNNSGNFIYISESYTRVKDVCFTGTHNNTTDHAAITFSDYGKVIRCVFHDIDNLSSGDGYGVYLNQGSEVFVYACIAYGCKTAGFFAYPGGSGDNTGVICCTSCENNGYGIYAGYYSQYCDTWSNLAAGNLTADFTDNGRPNYCGWNVSSDDTADINGDAGDNYKNSYDLLGSLDADYLPTTGSGFSANGSAGDRFGRNPYNDLFGTYDFDDFFKNDTSGEADSFLDIRGNTRPGSTTADYAWAVGAAEYEAPSPGGSGEIGLPFITLF